MTKEEYLLHLVSMENALLDLVDSCESPMEVIALMELQLKIVAEMYTASNEEE